MADLGGRAQYSKSVSGDNRKLTGAMTSLMRFDGFSPTDKIMISVARDGEHIKPVELGNNLSYPTPGLSRFRKGLLMASLDQFSPLLQDLSDLRDTLTSGIHQGRDVRCAFYEILPKTDTTPVHEVKTPEFIKRDVRYHLSGVGTDLEWRNEFISDSVIDWGQIRTGRELVNTTRPQVKQGFLVLANECDLAYFKKIANEAGWILGRIPNEILARCNISSATVDNPEVMRRLLTAVTECSLIAAHDGIVRPLIMDERDFSDTTASFHFHLEGNVWVAIFEAEDDILRSSKRVVNLLIRSLSQFPVEQPVSTQVEKPLRTRKDSAPRGAQLKLIAALIAHHKYSNGSCLNWEPIAGNELGRKAGIGSTSTSKLFIDKTFGGKDKYSRACADKARLVGILMMLNGEIDSFTRQLATGFDPADKTEQGDE